MARQGSHLNESQRAMVAARPANMPLGGAIYRSANLQTETPRVSQAAAARMLNVSPSFRIPAGDDRG
jgi:hypothetical protein